MFTYFRLFHYECYDRIKRKNYNIPELVDLFENNFPDNLLRPLADNYDKTYKFMVGTIAKFLSCYSLTRNGFKTYELFTEMLHQAARSVHKRLRPVEFRTQAPDHPILWAADESYYLKFYIFQVCEDR